MRAERWFHVLRLRLRSLLRRSRVEEELAEELSAHVDRQTRTNIASGMGEEEARRAALRAMGGLEQRKEECRDARGTRFLEELASDVRLALRSARRTPALATVVIVSLALGIGASTAIFSALDTVLLAPLPVHEPERLVQLTWSAADWPAAYLDDLEGSSYRSDDSPGMTSYSFPSRMLEAFAARGSTLETVFGFAANDDRVNVGLSGRAEDALLQAVSGGFFPGLGVRAVVGRTIVPSDDSPGAPPVAVASYRFWQRQMGGDAGAVGRMVVVNGTPVTLVGVAPPEFFGFERGNPPDLWVPLSLYAAQWRQLNPDQPLDNPRTWWLALVGRLEPGLSPAQAHTELSLAFQQNLEADPKASTRAPVPRLHVIPAKQGIDRLRRRFATSLWLLMAMVALLLLVACANVAALLLARAKARQPEIATRMSLGAPRPRLVRQLLTESIVLALAGGLVGLVVAVGVSSVLTRFLASGRNPVVVDVALDGRVLLFTGGLSLVCGVLFGLLPALRMTRGSEALPALRGARVTTGGGRPPRAGKVLVSAQVALGLLLLIGSGLMVRTLLRLQAADIGFERERLLVFVVKPGLNGYQGQDLVGYYEELRRRVAAVPGVRSAAFSMLGPIGSGSSSGNLEIPGVTPPGARVEFHRHYVGAGYFETLGVPVLEGRAIARQDVETAPRVAVVNEAFVRQHFHGTRPIGRILRQGSAERPLDAEVVGVVGDVKYNQLRDEVPPTAYFSYRQASRRADYVPPFMTYLVRTEVDPNRIVPAVERAALDLDAGVPLAGIRTETEVIDQVLFLERAFAWLVSAFGVLALSLACVGLVGTIGYTVARRTNEIGVRMALGAGRAAILALVLRETLVVVLGGIAAGIPLAWATTRLLGARLYELSPHDPATVAASVVVVLVVTLVAGLLPARRASRIDPMAALRCE